MVAYGTPQGNAINNKAPGYRPPSKKKKVPKSPLGTTAGRSIGSPAPAPVAAAAQDPLTSTSDPRFQEAAKNGMFGPGPAKKPKMSAYEKKRRSIQDIINDNTLGNDAYAANYNAARANIENAFAQAQGEIASRQAAGAGLLASMPGQIDATYGAAQQAMTADNAALDQAQAGMGVQSYMAPGVATAPVAQALQGEQASAKLQVPTLGVGLANLASEQRQQIGLDRGSALADLSTREEEAKAQASQNGPGWIKEQLIQEELAAQARAEAAAAKKKTGIVPGRDVISVDKGGWAAANYPRRRALFLAGKGEKHGQKAFDYMRGEMRKLSGMGPNKMATEMRKAVARARKMFPGNETAVSMAMNEALGG